MENENENGSLCPSSPHLVPCQATMWRVQGTATSVDTRGVRNWGYVGTDRGIGGEEMRWGLLCTLGENVPFQRLQILTRIDKLDKNAQNESSPPTALLPYKPKIPRFSQDAKQWANRVRLIGYYSGSKLSRSTKYYHHHNHHI